MILFFTFSIKAILTRQAAVHVYPIRWLVHAEWSRVYMSDDLKECRDGEGEGLIGKIQMGMVMTSKKGDEEGHSERTLQ
jgi:hypothetical protein